MFTGLIEDIGQIVEVSDIKNGKLIEIKTGLNTEEFKIGDSISINGACQTVVSKEEGKFSVETMKETLLKTNFGSFKKGDYVNLERAMSLNSRLDGHLVSGHIDGTAEIVSIKDDGLAKIFKIECDTALIVEKGSISINGISLTVFNVNENDFSVSILPHTLNNTNLKYLKQNSFVNIEYDMVGKYIKKFVSPKKESRITKEFLLENGF